MGNGNDGTIVIRCLDDDIDFSLTQLTLELGKKPNLFLKELIRTLRTGAYQQINVATFLPVVDPGAKKPNARLLAKHLGRGSSNGRQLMLTQAHGCPLDARLTRIKDPAPGENSRTVARRASSAHDSDTSPSSRSVADCAARHH